MRHATRKPDGAICIASLAAIFLFTVAAAAQDAAPPADAPTGAPAEGSEDETVQMTQPGTFEIHVQGADLRGVLQLLSTQGRRNIIATKGVSGTVTADLYGVTFREALEAVLRSTGFVYEEKGDFIYVYTPGEYEKVRQAERRMVTKTYTLYYVSAADAQTLIAPAMSSDGTIATTPPSEVGIGTDEAGSGGNNYATEDVLVVRDYEENIEQISEIIAQLDKRPQQVLIEATVLRASLTEGNHLGIEFNTLAGIDFEGLGSTSDAITNAEPGEAPASAFRDGAATFRTDLTSAVPAGGFTFGLITNNVSFFVRALESVTDVAVLANPKLLVLNKQRGEVLVGQRDGYITTTFTETTATQAVEFLETGTHLVVRPWIGRDEYIRMEVHPEDSSGSVEQIGEFALPRETTTEVTSNVLVKSGHTIVIGGLFRERSESGRAQVPVLGNVPYVGPLFRRTGDTTEREEVIVLITPRIVENESFEAVSEQLKDDVERFRIGKRKGLRWWGRPRLAQTHMRWARQAIAAGDGEKALWNVDMALSLEPGMDEAIHLKERLTNEAYWHDESRYSAIKYAIQRMVMQDMGRPVEQVIPRRKPLDVDKLAPEVRKALGIRKRPEPTPATPVDNPPVHLTPQTPTRPQGDGDGESSPDAQMPPRAVDGSDTRDDDVQPPREPAPSDADAQSSAAPPAEEPRDDPPSDVKPEPLAEEEPVARGEAGEGGAS